MACINKKITITILLSFFLIMVSCNTNPRFASVSTTEFSKVYIFIFDGHLREQFKNYILFRNYPVNVTDNETHLVLDGLNKEILIRIIEVLNLRIDIIRNNIVNVNTTRTTGGGAFIRTYMAITAENGIEILRDTNTKRRLVYDPTHPDAIQTGLRTGYVEMSNVDIFREFLDLYETVQLYNSIVDFIRNTHKNIIIERIPILSLEEFEHIYQSRIMLETIFRHIFEMRCNL